MDARDGDREVAGWRIAFEALRPRMPELLPLRLRASLLEVLGYRNPVRRISLISIISAGIRVGWRRVM